nr:MAG TPA: hypothetical protein [Caudoviricetes sp.]
MIYPTTIPPPIPPKSRKNRQFHILQNSTKKPRKP